MVTPQQQLQLERHPISCLGVCAGVLKHMIALPVLKQTHLLFLPVDNNVLGVREQWNDPRV
jgi:hypothetical protein